MTIQHSIRWAKVVYQPNLLKPVPPIPLGIIAEETRKGVTTVIVMGREPRGNIPELQLNDTWGPFEDSVRNWTANVIKSLPASTGVSLLDDLASSLKWNVFMRNPETKLTTLDIGEFAKRHWKELLREARPARRRPAASRRKSLTPWLSLRNEASVTAGVGA